MKWTRRATAAFALVALPLAVMAQANGAGQAAAHQGPTLTLDAEASQRVAQDTAWAMFSVEKESKDQAQAQQAGKAALGEVTAILKKSPALQVSTENLFTSPVYNKDGKITSWRTNFNLQFESTDTGYNMLMDYERRTPLFANLDVVAKFHAEQAVARGSGGE